MTIDGKILLILLSGDFSWKHSWEDDAKIVLKAHEQTIIRMVSRGNKLTFNNNQQVKTEGYDGKDNVNLRGIQEPTTWSIPSALLYSVTIITTIGIKSNEVFVIIL